MRPGSPCQSQLELSKYVSQKHQERNVQRWILGKFEMLCAMFSVNCDSQYFVPVRGFPLYVLAKLVVTAMIGLFGCHAGFLWTIKPYRS